MIVLCLVISFVVLKMFNFGYNDDNDDDVFVTFVLLLLLFWMRGMIKQCNECWNHKVYCIKCTYYKATVSGAGTAIFDLLTEWKNITAIKIIIVLYDERGPVV